MNRLSALVVLVVLGLSQHTQAQVNVIAGLGATTCGRWVESRALNDKGVDNFLVAWVQGFLSGMNAKGGIGHTIPGTRVLSLRGRTLAKRAVLWSMPCRS
jgi:hypothetical protein